MILKHHPSIKSTPNVGVHFEARELSLDSFVGWGRKPLSELQFLLSKIAGKDFLRAEDGFLCYQGHPCNGAVRQGLVVDASGIYYDSTKPSDLEKMVIGRAENPLSEDALRVVRQYINCIVSNGVGKYYEHQKKNETPHTLSGGVLIVEQIYGDCSLKYGGAENLNPDDVIKYALSISKGKPVLFKNHPDLINKKKGKRGFISSASESLKEKLVHLGQDVSSTQALGAIDHVVTVTSQFGFEALLASKRVHCFGSPFYAGWGLTEDLNLLTPVLSRRGLIAKPTIESLFLAAFYDYTTYVSSQTGELLELNEILTKFTGVELPKLSQFL